MYTLLEHDPHEYIHGLVYLLTLAFWIKIVALPACILDLILPRMIRIGMPKN